VGANTEFPAQRINILKIPVDNITEDHLEEALKILLSDGKNHQIVLLSVWDLMRARRNVELRTMLNNADLIVPISQSLVKGAKFLKRPVPRRYMPFDFIIKVLGALERTGKTIYILGSNKKNLQTAERNIRSTFPGLRVVGRFAGYYHKQIEPNIIQAVQKSTPSLLMVGRGVPGKERWIPRNLKSFQSGLYLWCDDVFDVFAEKRYRVSKKTFDRGLDWVPYNLGKIWRWPRAFTYLRYKVLLLVYRLKHW
jgi:N-acetylglucosaminyldiphosphoundecaprenol N-acetyl-beta-D-mannosaminyltransferase